MSVGADAVQHSAAHGRPGDPDMKRVTKDEWEAKTFKKSKTVPWVVELPEGALAKLIVGFRSMQMEDKWQVYSLGPDEAGVVMVYFFRSWTGLPIAEVKVKSGKPGEGTKDRFVAITWETGRDRKRNATAEPTKEDVLDVLQYAFQIEVERPEEELQEEPPDDGREKKFRPCCMQ